jgi:hypothetical protein
MDNQIQGEVTDRSVFVPWHPKIISLKEPLHAVTLSAMRDAGIAIYDIGGATCDQINGRRMALGYVGTRRAMSATWVAKFHRRHRAPTSICTSSAAHARRLLQHPADCVYANPRKRCIGGGSAEVMKPIISNALRPRVRKAS